MVWLLLAAQVRGQGVVQGLPSTVSWSPAGLVVSVMLMLPEVAVKLPVAVIALLMVRVVGLVLPLKPPDQLLN